MDSQATGKREGDVGSRQEALKKGEVNSLAATGEMKMKAASPGNRQTLRQSELDWKRGTQIETVKWWVLLHCLCTIRGSEEANGCRRQFDSATGGRWDERRK